MFITEQMLQQVRRNIREHKWAAAAADEIIQRAAPWRALSDEALWNLMFGATLPRATAVYPDGYCPACKAPVPMYTWRMDPINRPWKAVCPHCEEVFPKNDFGAYYQTGLDEHGVFDPKRADRSLLFNVEHPDSNDPQHMFGVDDGWGYRDGDKSWYFIATYLIALWKGHIIPGIAALGDAHIITGDPVYAHKAGVLLDRVADLYPTFDFHSQTINRVRTNGYVTAWHMACEDTREMALTYDAVRPVLASDAGLREFLAGQARRYRLDNPKAQWADIQRNIEDRILRDAVVNARKVESNYPRGAIAQDTFQRILEPHDDAGAQARLETIVERGTRVDGITGEKGLAAYSAYTIASLAAYLGQLSSRDPEFLPRLMERQPALRQTFRFHIDTWCLQRYYPNSGDGTDFADIVTMWDPAHRPCYAGMFLTQKTTLESSMFRFLMDLYKATGDAAYIQVMYHANNRTTDHLPYDLYIDDPAAFRQEVEQVIAKTGPIIQLPSVNKEQWCLGILRSGSGENARALWLDYDIGGGAHSHGDGMNLGLFALGLDILPDCGYPQIQYSGPEAMKAAWFNDTASHNTVVVDKVNQGKTLARGRTTLWADGSIFRGMRAAFEGNPLPVTGAYGQTYGSVALYSYSGGSFRQLRVWTRATNDDAWTLQFSDDFQRSELGSDWHVASGEWRIENGQVTGRGMLLCTRNFPGQQRVEYSASTDVAEPCDLSAYLGWNGENTGCFFGFGSGRNTGSKILVRDVVAAEGTVRIVAGQEYKVQCLCEEGRLQLIIDGAVAVNVTNMPNPAFRFVFGPRNTDPKQFERTVGMLDISAKDFYVIDIFRVVGGRDHTRFFHSYFGTVATEGLTLSPGQEYGGTLQQNFRTDANPKPGWQVDWTIEDKLKLLPPGTNVHLRHTDLTTGAEAILAESWVNIGNFNSKNEVWIPNVLTRRHSDGPLASTFVEVIEPYTNQSNIQSIRRLALQTPEGAAYPDNYVAIEVTLVDGRRDLIISADATDPLGRTPSLAQSKMLVQPEWGVRTDGELSVIRRDAKGQTVYTALSHGRVLDSGALSIRNTEPVKFQERQLS